MSDHEADDPALAGFITLQRERLQSLTRLQQNYKKDSASRKTESYYMKRLQQIESLNAAFETTHRVIICTEGYAKSNYFAKKIAVSFEDLFMETYKLQGSSRPTNKVPSDAVLSLGTNRRVDDCRRTCPHATTASAQV